MTQRDYYEILGINRNASDAEIKQAFRRLAMKHHPDRNPSADAEVKFKEIKEAYEVLSDNRKRTAYDQFGHAGVNPQMGGAGMGDFDLGNIFGDTFGDIFGDIFGGRGQRQEQRGADLRYDLEISLEDAVFGKKIDISIPTLVGCTECNGSGAKKGTKPSDCRTCAGQGQVRIQQGFFTIQQTCPNCRGSGQVITDPCTKCHGQGRKKDTRHLSVNIPAGIDHGDRIRLTGEGEAAAQGGTPGDLYVQMHIKPHPIFKRDGNDLHCQVPVSIAIAALGGEVEVPSLSGRIKIKLEEGTQSGKVYRLRGKGIKPVRGGSTGDLLCIITIETPVNLSRKQKDLLQSFEESLKSDNINHHPKESTWFDSVKRFFEDLKS